MGAQITAEEVAELKAENTDLKSRLSALEQANSDADIKKRIAAAVEEAEAKVAELEGQLETKTVEAAAAVKERDDLVAFLDAEKAAAEAADALEAAKATRIEAAKALGFLEDKFIEERAEAWAALSDEDWDARLGEFAALKPAGAPTSQPPADTNVGSGSIETAAAASGTAPSFGAGLAGLRGIDAKRA